MREANDSRLKIYEHLEVSVQDLEKANARLVLENTNNKKTIKRYVWWKIEIFELFYALFERFF